MHESRNAPMMEKAPVGVMMHGPIVSGVITFSDDSERVYNSATVFTADGRMSATYDKLHLLWFGESVPLADEIPWIRTVFARGTGMIAGQKDVGLTVAGVRVAILNCFEDTLPRASVEAATVDPEILLNLTNDAWFSGTTESALHLRIAGLRSVELRRDLLRSVNGGLTSWYDAGGRLRETIPGDKPAWLTVDAARLNLPPTLYARFGDWPMAILLVAAIADAIRRKRRTPAAS
jgi:apolipoprotein N-acyltransferase